MPGVDREQGRPGHSRGGARQRHRQVIDPRVALRQPLPPTLTTIAIDMVISMSVPLSVLALSVSCMIADEEVRKFHGRKDWPCGCGKL